MPLFRTTKANPNPRVLTTMASRTASTGRLAAGAALVAVAITYLVWALFLAQWFLVTSAFVGVIAVGVVVAAVGVWLVLDSRRKGMQEPR